MRAAGCDPAGWSTRRSNDQYSMARHPRSALDNPDYQPGLGLSVEIRRPRKQLSAHRLAGLGPVSRISPGHQSRPIRSTKRSNAASFASFPSLQGFRESQPALCMKWGAPRLEVAVTTIAWIVLSYFRNRPECMSQPAVCSSGGISRGSSWPDLLRPFFGMSVFGNYIQSYPKATAIRYVPYSKAATEKSP